MTQNKDRKLINHLILTIVAIVISLFLYDLQFNFLETGLTKAKFLIRIIITMIILLHIVWWSYSKIISLTLKKDLKKILKKDAITYLPFLLLILFPLRYLAGNLESKFDQFSHIPPLIILILASGIFIVLKVIFLEIAPKKKRPLKTLAIIAILIFFLTFSTLGILKHHSFFSTGYDLGIYDQTMYGYTKGKILDSVMGLPLLGDHIEWILFLILPVYALFQTPITLIMIQALFISAGAFVLYFLSKTVLKSEVAALILCISYLIHPAIHYVALSDFHTTVLPLPFIFLAIYSIIKRKYKLLALSLFFIAITKEYLVLIFIPIGIFLFFMDLDKNDKFLRFKKISPSTLFSKQRKIGIAIILIGIIWFLINVSILIPLFYEGTNYSGYNPYFGDTLTETVTTIITRPIYTLQYVFTLDKIAFLALFSVPFFFYLFAIFAPEYLFLGITELAVMFLYNEKALAEIVYHRQILLVAFTLTATLIGIKRLSNLIKYKKKENIIIAFSIGVLFTTLLANLSLGPFTLLYDLDDFNTNTLYVKDGHKILDMIPEDASVIAPNWVLPHLSNREEIYMLRHLLMYKEGIVERVIEGRDYIIIDLSDALTDPKRSARAYRPDSLTVVFKEKDYGILATEGTWLLLKKGENYEENICKILPYLNKTKYPYLDIKIEEETLKKCQE